MAEKQQLKANVIRTTLIQNGIEVQMRISFIQNSEKSIQELSEKEIPQMKKIIIDHFKLGDVNIYVDE